MKILDKIRPFKQDRRTTPAPRPLVIVSTSFQNPRIKQTSLDTTGEVPSLEGIFAIDINNTGFLPTRGTRITNANVVLKKGESSINIGKITEPVSLPSIPPGEIRTVKMSFERESTFVNQLVEDLCDQKVVTAEIDITIAELLLAATYNETVELQISQSDCTTLELDITGQTQVNLEQTYEWNVSSVGGQEISDVTWSMGDGTSKSGTTIQHEYSTEGTYEIKAEVPSGISASIEVTAESLPLSIVGTQQPEVNQEIVYQATGPIADRADRLVWDMGDGSDPKNGTSVSHTYTSPGVRTIVVSSDAGNEAEMEVTPEFPDVEVNIGGNQNVVFGTPEEYVVTGEQLSKVETFVWTMGDATPPYNGQSVTHAYDSADSGGDPVTHEIEVSAQIQNQEVASNTLSVTASFSDIQVSLPDESRQVQTNNEEEYSATADKIDDATDVIWDMGDGTLYKDSDGDLGDDPLSVSHTYNTSGDYEITLQAQIDGNMVAEDTQDVDATFSAF
jgi:plastocyanin